MHNPVTCSGGVMLGRVLDVAADIGAHVSPDAACSRRRLRVGARVVPMVRWVECTAVFAELQFLQSSSSTF
jgi:hypothetical protein